MTCVDDFDEVPLDVMDCGAFKAKYGAAWLQELPSIETEVDLPDFR